MTAPLSVNAVVVDVRKLLSSNKAVAAAFTTLAGTVIADGASFISSGQFDATEIRVGLAGLATALLTGGVTWLVNPGKAVVDVPTPAPAPPVV